jgi:hypothetical protein
MAAFTVNAITTKGSTLILDAYSTDVSTSTALLAASAGNEYLIISVSFEINHSDTWFKLFDDTTLRLGPIKPRTHNYHREYKSPIRIAGAINIQTESDKQIHVTIEYKLRTTTL